jgi:hypothetical protein
MTKQGNGAESEVAKMSDTAVVDFPPIRITAMVQRASRPGAFLQKKAWQWEISKGTNTQTEIRY